MNTFRKFAVTLILMSCSLAIIGAALLIAYFGIDYYLGTKTYSDLQHYIEFDAVSSVENGLLSEQQAQVPIVDFEALAQINPDVVGWIFIPDTRVNYPIVKRANDNDYYLSHIFDGSQNKTGSIFLDTRNSFGDSHVLIHGHNMGNGAMFRDLELFKNRQFFQDHPYFFLFTPDQNFIVELFAGSIVRIDSPVWQLDFSGPTDIQEWLLHCRMAASVSRNLTVTPDNHVITLSTCTYEYKQARWILQGVISPMDEADSELIETLLSQFSVSTDS